MQLGMHQVQKLSQRLIMTPQMQQSVKLLQMNTMELETLAETEMLENPFLEMEEEDRESTGEQIADEGMKTESAVLVEEKNSNPDGEQPEPSDTYETKPQADNNDVLATPPESSSDKLETASLEEQPAQFEEVDTDWKELFEESYRLSSYKRPVDDSEDNRFEETVASKASLYEHLNWQLRVSALSEKESEIGRFLIGCIDEDGLLQSKSTPQECAEKFRLKTEKVEEILATVEELRMVEQNLEALNKLLANHFQTKELEAAEFLAGYLDSGILQRKPTLEICAEKFDVEPLEIEKMLIRIQEFDPTGVGALDLPECLCLQLAANDDLDILTKEVLFDFWPELIKKKFREIAKAKEVAESEIEDIFRRVQKLDPAPGRRYSKSTPAYISPDVFVKKLDGKYIIYLNEGQVAHLRLSKVYRDILLNPDHKGVDPKEREYAMDKFRSAVNFIKNVEKRRSTIMRVTEAIMDYQAEFLEKGVEALRPLALSEIAERVSMHESTISRVTSGKYVNTPQGLYELKFFFSSAIRSSHGEAASSRSIRQKIRELIDEEDSKKPLSDDKIAKILKGQGFSIARRTVAKYREQMKILSTNLRRMRD